MDTQLLVLTKQDEWLELDLYEDVSINVIIQETDVTDVEARRSPYSKTFTIPGTKHNNAFFEHFYEVNGVGFDPLTRKPTVVQYRGTEIFKGYLRLNAIIQLEEKIEYEVYILSEVTDFNSIVGDTTLRELNWIEYNHIQNYDTVTLSWAATSGDTAGLFGGKIIYPMIHYGLDYQSSTATTAAFEFAINTSGNTGIDFSGSAMNPTYFKPAIRVKAVLEKIFENGGYTIKSDFFESPYFRSIYIDLAQNGLLGVNTVSAQTNQNIFKVYSDQLPQGQKFNYSNGDIQQINMGRISTTDGYDPSLNFNETYGAYQIPYSGLYSFEFKGKINQIFANNFVSTYYGISIYKASTPQGLRNPAARTVVAGTADNLFALNYNNSNNIRLFFNNVDLNAGDWVGIFIRFNNSGSSNKNAGLWVGPTDWIGYGARWELYNSPFFIASNFVDMKIQFPDLSSVDFVKSIIKMFNLVIVQTDETKTLRIEPLNWYYSENISSTKDWTNRIDLNSPIKLEPLSFQLKKAYNLQYTSGEEEYLNKLWEDQYEIPYGTKKFTAKSDILTGEETLEFPFRACPTDVISGSTNIIIPKVYKLDLATGKEIAYANKSHLFFWTGNRYFYQDQGNVGQKTWYLTSGGTPISQTTYPCVSHLSTLDNLDPEEISDLNFDKSFDFFGQENDLIQQFTANNVYQLWYNDYFTNIFSPETRRLTARILFNPLDVYQTKLTDKIFIKDSIFRIERINEADLVNWKLTEVSLLKNVAQYNKVNPPAPDHSLAPNTPYPASGTPISITGFVSTNQSEICTNSASPTSLYATSNPVTQGSQIFYDSLGTSAYTRGNFFRQTTTSQTYAVINAIGTLSEDNC